jgi:hypothetical protein
MPKKNKTEARAFDPAAPLAAAVTDAAPSGAPDVVAELTPDPVPCATRPRNAKPPRNHRELAQAIFDQCDVVKVGRELLEASQERSANNTVRARVWETLVDFLFGKQPPAGAGNASSSPNVRIVWDLPAPPHETDKP